MDVNKIKEIKDLENGIADLTGKIEKLSHPHNQDNKEKFDDVKFQLILGKTVEIKSNAKKIKEILDGKY